MTSTGLFALPIVVLGVLLTCMVSLTFILKKIQNLFWIKRKTMPSATELRMRKIPVIESTPFWVPGGPGHADMVGLEIQPSAHAIMPYATKSRRGKVHREEVPKLKFSIQYHQDSGLLQVELLDAANIALENLSDECFDDEDSVFLFTDVFLKQQETQKRMRSLSRRRRRRFESFEIELNYEALQLQTLQFCVMGYDVYSRQKVIGDVLLPLAELAQQGIDITKELVMWRDVQTSQPSSQRLCERISQISSIEPGQGDSSQASTSQPPDSQCSTS
ncbi:synaptotagmin-5-like [Montipora capricornis]|uniref:synaptotagmin-5-like n=1 Tax=Montipora capricornis TaxID=246305 RepID=UPI0035F21CC1